MPKTVRNAKGSSFSSFTDIYEAISIFPALCGSQGIYCDLPTVYREVQEQVNTAGCVELPQGDGL